MNKRLRLRLRYPEVVGSLVGLVWTGFVISVFVRNGAGPKAIVIATAATLGGIALAVLLTRAGRQLVNRRGHPSPSERERDRG
jgi:hypothetical protein